MGKMLIKQYFFHLRSGGKLLYLKNYNTDLLKKKQNISNLTNFDKALLISSSSHSATPSFLPFIDLDLSTYAWKTPGENAYMLSDMMDSRYADWNTDWHSYHKYGGLSTYYVSMPSNLFISEEGLVWD